MADLPRALLWGIHSLRACCSQWKQPHLNKSWAGRELPVYGPAAAILASVFFGFQRELPWNIVADVSYVGNQTRKLPVTADLNALPVSELGKASTYYTKRVNNPMAGLLPDNGAKNGATIPRQDLLMPYPQYTGVSASNVPIGKQRYDAMQSSLTKRFSSGVTFRINYTIANLLEQVSFLNSQDFNLTDIQASKLEKRLVDYDAPQHFAVLGSMDLPFGRHKKWGSTCYPIANFFLGGWNIAGNYNRRSGSPLAFPNAAPVRAGSAKLSGAQRDELAAKYGQKYWDVSYVPFFDVSLFPKLAGPAPFTLRDFPTRFPDVRSFGLNNLDLERWPRAGRSASVSGCTSVPRP